MASNFFKWPAFFLNSLYLYLYNVLYKLHSSVWIDLPTFCFCFFVLSVRNNSVTSHSPVHQYNPFVFRIPICKIKSRVGRFALPRSKLCFAFLNRKNRYFRGSFQFYFLTTKDIQSWMNTGICKKISIDASGSRRHLFRVTRHYFSIVTAIY